MTADLPHLELLWRHLDGEPLDASESATLDAALAADPVLREISDLHQQTRSLVRNLPTESAPVSISTTISKGIATPPPVAKLLLFGLPLQRFGLVAALLLAVLGGAYLMRPAPFSHETAMVNEHLAAVAGRVEMLAMAQAEQRHPGEYSLQGLRFPEKAMLLEKQRDCLIVDCPATQYFGTLPDGTPLSVFIVAFATHLELRGFAVASGGLSHDYGVIHGDEGTTMVAWIDRGLVYSLVAHKPADDLIRLAEQSHFSLGSIPVILQLAALNRMHTIQ